MGRRVRSGAGDVQFEDEYEQCSRCESWNRYDRTPRGGRFTSKRTNLGTDSVTGKTVFRVESGYNGCWFCDSPAWDGYAKPRRTIRLKH